MRVQWLWIRTLEPSACNDHTCKILSTLVAICMHILLNRHLPTCKCMQCTNMYTYTNMYMYTHTWSSAGPNSSSQLYKFTCSKSIFSCLQGKQCYRPGSLETRLTHTHTLTHPHLTHQGAKNLTKITGLLAIASSKVSAVRSSTWLSDSSSSSE